MAKRKLAQPSLFDTPPPLSDTLQTHLATHLICAACQGGNHTQCDDWSLRFCQCRRGGHQ
jgi:hypothetical protein